MLLLKERHVGSLSKSTAKPINLFRLQKEVELCRMVFRIRTEKDT